MSSISNIKVNNINYDIAPASGTVTSASLNREFKEYLLNGFVGTYDQIKELVNDNSLIAGNVYTITDYLCIYTLPVTNSVMESELDGWLLHLVAKTLNSFFEDIEVTFTEDSSYRSKGGKDIIACKYSFTNNSRYDWAVENGKGVIYYLKDEFQNELPYDFKHIKFRRWKITNLSPNKNTTSSTGQFRFCASSFEGSRDPRSYTGSGSSFDEELVDSIFDGTYRTKFWYSDPHGYNGNQNFTDSYTEACKLETIYPWKNNDFRAYGAWTIDMNTDMNKVGTNISSMINIEVNPSAYKDCYTFDIDGQDASNVTFTSASTGKSNPSVSYVTIKSGIRYTLPNTVFLGANKNNYLAYIVTLETADRNTFIGIANNNAGGYISSADIKDCRYNLIYSILIHLSSFNMLRYNYLVVYMLYIKSKYSFNGNVVFGRYSGCRFDASSMNLLFAAPYYIQTTSSTNWTVCQDGTYWYDTDVWGNWFGYNILGPCLYANIGPHFNTNTIPGNYNKGFKTLGVFLMNTILGIRWGCDFGYGFHFLYLGIIRSSSFIEHCLVPLGGDSEKRKMEAYTTGTPINISSADFNTRFANLSTLTDELKTMLASWSYSANPSRKLVTNNLSGTITVGYWDDLWNK